MKIEQSDNNLNIGGIKKPQTDPVKPGEISFETILKNSIANNKSSASPEGESTPIPRNSHLSSILQKKFEKMTSLKKVEELLVSLDLYKSALADKAIKFSSMKNIMSEIDERSNEAMESAMFLSDDDPLKNIISEAAFTVSEEKRRFLSFTAP